MVVTELTGDAVPPYDLEIAKYLESEEFDGDGSTMIIGVENEGQNIYRIINVSGLGDFMNVIGFLWDVGLTDILESSTKAVRGFDAIFRFEQATH